MRVRVSSALVSERVLLGARFCIPSLLLRLALLLHESLLHLLVTSIELRVYYSATTNERAALPQSRPLKRARLTGILSLLATNNDGVTTEELESLHGSRVERSDRVVVR